MKKALITGITGQDGSYLAEFLLSKKYAVYGIKRRSSLINTKRIDHIFEEIQKKNKKFHLFYGDLTDTSNLINLVNKIKPDEIYNLGAQSHVSVSFETPEYTANTDAIGTLRLLEAIRILNLNNKTKFYQASTSEIFGKTTNFPIKIKTPFKPVSPYGTSKLFSYWIVRNYRDAYNIHASNGILFNHESPRRGENFITRKVTRSAAKHFHKSSHILYVGNLEAKRDWGHAKDFVRGMWNILQQKNSSDYLLSTGKSYSVRELIEIAYKVIGIDIKWTGKNIKETGFDTKNNKTLIKIDKNYFRPNEIDKLEGDTTDAYKRLKWKPKISFREMIKEMVLSDINEFKKN
jgi:GDPmannose 4,6-dehydratase